MQSASCSWGFHLAVRIAQHPPQVPDVHKRFRLQWGKGLFCNLFFNFGNTCTLKLLSTALLHTSPASPTWHKFMNLAFSGQAHLDLPLPECPAPVPWVPCCVLLQCVCLGIIIVATNSIHWGVVWYKLIQPQSKSLHHLQLDQLLRFSCHLLPKHTWQTRFLLLRD